MSDFTVLIEAKQSALTRLIKAARVVDRGAVVVDKDTCEVPLEDLQELSAAIKEWGK